MMDKTERLRPLLRELETALVQVRETHYEFPLHDTSTGDDVRPSLRVLENLSERMFVEIDAGDEQQK